MKSSWQNFTVEPRYSAIEGAEKIHIKSRFALYRGQFEGFLLKGPKLFRTKSRFSLYRGSHYIEVRLYIFKYLYSQFVWKFNYSSINNFWDFITKKTVCTKINKIYFVFPCQFFNKQKFSLAFFIFLLFF
jgi:hypothetical protein